MPGSPDSDAFVVKTQIAHSLPLTVLSTDNEIIGIRTTSVSELFHCTVLTSFPLSLRAQTDPEGNFFGPYSVAGHAPTLPWVRSRVRVREGVGRDVSRKQA